MLFRSYGGGTGTVRGELKIADQLTMITPSLGDTVLLVDDLVDSGATLEKVRQHLLERYPAIKEVRTAVLWRKASARFTPEYQAEFLAESPWIHQPFEHYDSMSAQELRNRTR